MTQEPTEGHETLIASLVERFREERDLFHYEAENLRRLVEVPQLRRLYHSLRWRIKDPSHLGDKLRRQLEKAENAGLPFEISSDNLFTKINDLIGLRILHLHTSEFWEINRVLLELLEEGQYKVLEGPTARVWDDEYRTLFEENGIPTVKSERMYTSVHYVVEGRTRTIRTAEIQVRTLAEELWGEVDHSINYPIPSTRLACREQIKVLARVTSSVTRLVDSIFVTNGEPG